MASIALGSASSIATALEEKRFWALSGHDAGSRITALQADRRCMISACATGRLLLWDSELRNVAAYRMSLAPGAAPSEAAISAACIDASGDAFIAASPGGDIHLIDAYRVDLIRRSTAARDTIINDVAAHPIAAPVAAFVDDAGTLSLRDFRDPKVATVRLWQAPDPLTRVAFDTAARCYVGGVDGVVSCVSSASRGGDATPLWSADVGAIVNGICVAEDSAVVCVTTMDGAFTTLDATTGAVLSFKRGDAGWQGRDLISMCYSAAHADAHAVWVPTPSGGVVARHAVKGGGDDRHAGVVVQLRHDVRCTHATVLGDGRVATADASGSIIVG